ncbi:hypothetical protein GCM10018793_03270 [Streptomyces sulfonofaciens]|uniref:Copper chaperone PCu(A)C n=1 Tax=Streptomyces sulfonofaciens TaxID=68272 RepID=A0A919FQQ9_9ACTN|nr:copper chaperone PCu(A)C [Streptomyces sulfonofaciens]GHH69960.1 hypothetical protein GCM10018793_03270 [Streptomyces sulfonofaciens]
MAAPTAAAGARARVVALALAAVVGCGALAGCGGGSGADGTDGTGGRSGGQAAADTAARPHLRISGAFLPVPVTTGLAAGFCVVRNTGGADTLTSVTSDIADRVTLHRTRNGRMEMQDSFPVPAHGALDFSRGGNHLMFEQLTHKPKVGDTVTVRLHFRRSGTLTVKVPVRPATYNPGAGGAFGTPPDGAGSARTP